MERAIKAECKPGPRQQTSGARLAPELAKASWYPTKPMCSGPRPGNPVDLESNLFLIKPLESSSSEGVYRFGIEVEVLGEKESQHKSERIFQRRRKLPRDVVHALVDKVIERMTGLDHNFINQSADYCLDSTGLMMFTLIDLFKNELTIEQEDGKRSLTIDGIEMPSSGGRVEEKKRLCTVKFVDGKLLNLRALMKDFKMINMPELTRCLLALMVSDLSNDSNKFIVDSSKGSMNVIPFIPEEQFSLDANTFGNHGYKLSIRPAEIGIVLNLSNTVRPIYRSTSLLEFVRELEPKIWLDFSKPLPRGLVKKLAQELHGKQVEVAHNPGRKHRVQLVDGSARDTFHWLDDNGRAVEISIEAYFMKQYPEFKLKYAHLPCVIDGGRKFPLELCKLVERQAVSRQLNAQEQFNMIRQTAMAPENHFKRVQANLDKLASFKRTLNHFGLDIDTNMIQVQARELQPLPMVCSSLYRGSLTLRSIRPNNGQFVAKHRFLVPATCQKVAIGFIFDSSDRNNFREQSIQDTNNLFGDYYLQVCQRKGLSMSRPSQAHSILKSSSYDELDELTVNRILRQYYYFLMVNNYEHAIVVIPRSAGDSLSARIQYLEVASSLDRHWKRTRLSRIKSENFVNKILKPLKNNGREPSSFVENLLLKYNSKLGGINYALEANDKSRFLADGYLFLGVDICHPNEGHSFKKSIAAMVGLWGITGIRRNYCTQLRAQLRLRPNSGLNSTVEELLAADEMLAVILNSYLNKRQELPQNIVIFRDGVSEGQIEMVAERELKKMKAAIENICKLTKLSTRPKVTYLIVQKRHHIRMKKIKPSFNNRNNSPDFNLTPGTVVDHKITRPKEFAMYLAPHKANQGTAKSPYFSVLLDEIEFSQDEIQQMIHGLSYLSPRTNKCTSVPTPINLADLAAERGRNLADNWVQDNGCLDHKDPEDSLRRLNEFFSQMGDKNYNETLYYV